MTKLIAATLILAFAYLIYSSVYPTVYFRVRISLDVETPQGVKNGSSVIQVRTERYPRWMTLGNFSADSSVEGETVFVDLGTSEHGKSQNLVALLAFGPSGRDPDFYLLPGEAFEPFWKDKVLKPEYQGSSRELQRLPAGSKIALDLNGKFFPTLVTFMDLTDPKSARLVAPNNLSQEFGSGFALRDAQIEIVKTGTWPWFQLDWTGPPLTRQIESKLPFINQLKEAEKNIMIERAEDPFRVRPGQLTRGF